MDVALIVDFMKKLLTRWRRSDVSVHPEKIKATGEDSADKEGNSTDVDVHQSTRQTEQESSHPNKFIDKTQWSKCFARYIDLANICNRMIQSKIYDKTIILCIVVAGVLVGLQLYPSLEQHTMIKALEEVILVLFSSECVMKIIAEGVAFWRYFIGPDWQWNVFDFVLVIACIPFTPWYSILGNHVGALRLFRLLRLAKIIHKFPQLQMIVTGLIGGVRSVLSIGVLLFLVLYMYAILGIMSFQENDPWHWSSLKIALITLFRAATLEDWSDIMYFNIYGCNEYKTGGGIRYCDVERENCTGVDPMFHCTKPSKSYVVAPLYFISFIIITAFVMVSMFVGAITMAMAESMEKVKADADKRDRLRRLKRGKRRAIELWNSPIANTNTGSSEDSNTAGEKIQPVSGIRHRKMAKMKTMLRSAWEGSDFNQNETDHSDNYTGWKRTYCKLASRMDRLTQNTFFGHSITAAIVLAGVSSGLSTYQLDSLQYQTALKIIDQVVSIAFAFEVMCKVIACEFEPGLYFQNKGNLFDFAVVIGSFLPGAGSLLVMLRLMRLLRVLKLVNKLPQLQIIVTALLIGMGSIGYIGIMLVLFFYIYAVVGCSMFRSNDPWHFGTLHMSMFTLFRCSTLEDWSDVMYTNLYGCDKFGYTEQMNKGSMGCTDPSPVPFTTVYFITFIVLGALVLMTLFIGVVTTSMEEATVRMDNKILIDYAVEKAATECNIPRQSLLQYRAVFDLLDLDGGGTIELHELKVGLAAIGKQISSKEVYEIIQEVDVSGDCELDFAEFLHLMILLKKRKQG